MAMAFPTRESLQWIQTANGRKARPLDEQMKILEGLSDAEKAALPAELKVLLPRRD